MSDKEIKHTYLNIAMTIMMYCSSSVIIGLSNRVILSDYKVDGFTMMLAAQCGVSVIFLMIAHYIGILKLKKVKLDSIVQWTPVTIAFTVMLYSSVRGQKNLEIAKFLLFKNASLMWMMIGENIIYKTPITFIRVLAVGFIISSPMVVTYTDKKSNIEGYLWMIVNMLAIPCYSFYMKIMAKKLNFGDSDTALYNNMMTFPIMLCTAIGNDEIRPFVNIWFSGTKTSEEIFGLCKWLILNFASSFTIALGTAGCIAMLSPTTFSVIGTVNKIPCTLSGYIILKDKSPNKGETFGIILSLIGCSLYTYGSILVKRLVDSQNQQKKIEQNNSQKSL